MGTAQSTYGITEQLGSLWGKIGSCEKLADAARTPSFEVFESVVNHRTLNRHGGQQLRALHQTHVNDNAIVLGHLHLDERWREARSTYVDALEAGRHATEAKASDRIRSRASVEAADPHFGIADGTQCLIGYATQH